jgi:hypothetical protein
MAQAYPFHGRNDYDSLVLWAVKHSSPVNGSACVLRPRDTKDTKNAKNTAATKRENGLQAYSLSPIRLALYIMRRSRREPLSCIAQGLKCFFPLIPRSTFSSLAPT